MCGIVAYYGGSGEVVDTLMSGLRRLEYRGYDSSGVALMCRGSLVYNKKAIGKVIELEKGIIASPPESLLKIGIAHTRWATHGIPSVANAHPHRSFDHKIWLVHNGIIENYKELKDEMISEGLEFYSQTDTEVVANLIASNYQGNFKEAVIKSLNKLRGAFALAIICKDEPDNLIVAKFGAPLVLGLGKNDFIVASDVSAIISRTREVIYLEDGELVEISGDKYKISDFAGKDLDKNTQTVEWDEESASKEGFDHFLIKEIMEQPKATTDSIRGRLLKEGGDVRFGGLIDIGPKLPEIENILLIGVGTSFYAAKLGELYFEELAGIPVKVEMSPEFRYKNSVINQKTWVIALSQSGETADTIVAVQEAKRKGALVTGITNVVGSTLSRITDAGVYNHIGPEISVASTKAFTSQSVILLMHAILIGRMKHLGFSEGKSLVEEILKLPSIIEKVLSQNANIDALARKYFHYNNLIYLGRKYNFPIALEGALKLKEISYIHAEGLSGGELKHGFIALVDENFPTIAIATKDSVYEKMISNLMEIKARKGPILALATEGDVDILEICDDVIFVPKVGVEQIQPIVNNIVLQLFAYHCSVLKGLDVDKPRNLAKSVTVE